MNLNNLRKQIDRLDEDIVHKLNRRLEIGLRIRNLKRKLGKGVYSPEREYQVFKKLKDIPANIFPIPPWRRSTGR